MYLSRKCIQLQHQLYIHLANIMLDNLQTIRLLSMKIRVEILEELKLRIFQGILVLVMPVLLILVMMDNF